MLPMSEPKTYINQEDLIPRLPPSSLTLFEAKKMKNLSFEAIAKEVGRDEVAIAALFYGQAMASPEDIQKLSQVLQIPVEDLESQLSGFPDRGRSLDQASRAVISGMPQACTSRTATSCRSSGRRSSRASDRTAAKERR